MSLALVTPRSVENGQYNSTGKVEASNFIVFINIVNTLTHLILGAVAISAIMFANMFHNTTSFKQHIYLCVTGYIILMSQAVLAFNPQSGWTSMISHEKKKMMHILMQLVGSSLALIGSIIRIISIDNHFETTHGILGVVAMAMTFLSLLRGVFDLSLAKLKISPMFMKIAHPCFGTLTLCVAFICLAFAFNKDLFVAVNGNVNSNLLISLTVIGMCGTVTSAWISTFKRLFR